jgi:NosR/NirI family nitrous oxide reductase transcriptional regulator
VSPIRHLLAAQLKALWLAIIPLILLLSIFLSSPVQALFVSPAKEPLPIIKEIFSEHNKISEKTGEPAIWTIYKDDEILGYAFETNDIAKIPAYSGEPVNMLVAINAQGNYLGAKVLEHHEPIILAGIPESKLHAFADQYPGLKVSDRIKVGGNKSDDMIHIDGLSGATVTVMVMNVAITKSATKVARALGLISASAEITMPMATIYPDVYQRSSWQQLTGDGSIRKLLLKRGQVDDAFLGTEAEQIEQASPEQKQDTFTEIYYAQVNIPQIGKNLLGEHEYNWLNSLLKPGEHAIALLGNGYSFKGSGYVRGGIFDRIQVLQNNNAIAFRDLDHHRITDIYLDGAPDFKEMSLFIIREHHEFNPGVDWQFELLVRRQIGAIDSTFTSFKGDYHTLEQYVERPPIVTPAPELTLTEQVWQEKNTAF